MICFLYVGTCMEKKYLRVFDNLYSTHQRARRSLVNIALFVLSFCCRYFHSQRYDKVFSFFIWKIIYFCMYTRSDFVQKLLAINKSCLANKIHKKQQNLSLQFWAVKGKKDEDTLLIMGLQRIIRYPLVTYIDILE